MECGIRGRRRLFRLAALVLAPVLATGVLGQPARAAEKPITVGFGMALTGGLAPNGRAALLAMQLWAKDTNAQGGLLGRPVKLVYYDDQSNPATVPGIYTKLLDIDHVDLVVSDYATNMIAPAMPIVMAHQMTYLGLLGLDVNAQFHDPDYFSIAPTGGPDPSQSISQGFFAVAASLKPKPQTIAMVGADAQFSINALKGGRALAKQYGFKVVYDRTYPPGTVDYTPIVRAIQAAHPDLVLVCSYPPDSVGMIRAAREVGLEVTLFGGAMVGLQATAIKTELGPLLNGVVDYDFWLPVGGFATPEAVDFLKEYQEAAKDKGVDQLGYYLPTFAYSDLQVLAQAVDGTNGLDQQKLADYMRTHTFHTVVGDIKFGPNGEWVAPRVLEAQFQGVLGHGVEQFTNPKTEVVLWPDAYKDGKLRFPYVEAQH
jgi:branched-chain amino acid transport system substrate-binding protein